MKKIIQKIKGFFAKPNVSRRENTPLENQLVAITNGTYTGKRLYFNNETGELEMEDRKKELSADCTTLDQIAEDGFMADFTFC